MRKSDKEKTEEIDFEARQNALGFFSVALEVVLRDSELRKKIFEETNKKENNV